MCVLSTFCCLFLMIADIYRMHSVYLKLRVVIHLRHMAFSFSKITPVLKISWLLESKEDGEITLGKYIFLIIAIQQVHQWWRLLWIFYGDNEQLKSGMATSTFDLVAAYLPSLASTTPLLHSCRGFQLDLTEPSLSVRQDGEGHRLWLSWCQLIWNVL